MLKHTRGFWVSQFADSSNLLGCLHQLLVRYLSDVRPENDLDEITRNAFEGKDDIKARLDILNKNLTGLTPYQKGIAYGAQFSNRDVLSRPVDLETLRCVARDFGTTDYIMMNPGLSTLDTHNGIGRDLILPAACIPRSLALDISTSETTMPAGPPPPAPTPSWLYEIYFSGIYCYQQTTNEATEGSDEPYVIWVGVDAETGATWQAVSEEFSSVITGTAHSPSGMNPPIYGPASNSGSAVILATLCESDLVGNTEGTQQVIQAFMGWIRTMATATWVTPTGIIPGVTLACAIYQWLKYHKVTDWFFNLIGDDVIGTSVILVWPNSLAPLATSSTYDHEGISYHIWQRHLSPASDYYTFYTVGSTL